MIKKNWWNFWFNAFDQKLLLVTFYVKSYLALSCIHSSADPGASNTSQTLFGMLFSKSSEKMKLMLHIVDVKYSTMCVKHKSPEKFFK